MEHSQSSINIIKFWMNSELQSQSQVASDRSYVDLGLMLTQKVLSTKTKLKQINPTLIYEWDGETINNQISGKGTFVVRNSLNNQLVFECEVKKWKNGVPEGNIKMKKINFFSSQELTDFKVKEIHSYDGSSQNLKKHGQGTYILQQFYSSGKVKKTTIVGQWSSDILIQGTMQNQFGKKELNLASNVQWSKSAKSIALEQQKIPVSITNVKDQNDNKNSRLFKENTNLLPQPSFKQKYLAPKAR